MPRASSGERVGGPAMSRGGVSCPVAAPVRVNGPVEWAARGEGLGAGEILLTSMDSDGVQTGFDCPLTRTVSRATHIPVIASGGAGKEEHFLEVLTTGEADAALAASIFHYGTYTVSDLKEYLDKRGIPVRLA